MEKYRTESSYPIEVDLTGSSAEAYGRWAAEFEKLLGNCFAKKKVKEGEPPRERKVVTSVRRIIADIGKKGRIQRKIAYIFKEKLVELESRQMEKFRSEKLRYTMSQLTANEKFSPVGYWKMKQSIKKKERKTEVVSSVRKENGVEVDGPEQRSL